MLFAVQPLTSVLAQPLSAMAKGLPASKRQLIEHADNADVAHVESGRAPIRAQVKGIGNESRRISGGRGIQGISIVKRLRPGVDAADRHAVTHAVIHVHLQSVIGTVTQRKPCPSVGNRGVGLAVPAGM